MEVFFTKTERKKTQILEAMFRCIVKDGIIGMTTRSIAKEANVNQSMLRYYFGSKKNLLQEFVAAFFDRAIFEVRRRTDELDSPERKLESIFEAGKDYCTKHREMCMVYISCWSYCMRHSDFQETLSKHYERLWGSIQDILDEGKRAGAFNEVRTDSLSIVILSFVQGLSLVQWNMPLGSSKLSEHYDMFVTQLKSMILKSRP